MLSEEQLREIEERTDDNAQSLNYFCTDLHEDVRRYLKHVDDVRTLLEAIRELQARATLYDQVKAVLAATQARVAELETWLPKDDEDTWYCPKCHMPSSTDDWECPCGYERTGDTPVGNADFDVVYIDGKPCGKVVLE